MLRQILFVLVALLPTAAAHVEAPLAMRITNLPVTPAHMPAVKVWVKNTAKSPYQGKLTLELPDGWKLSPTSQDLSLQPSETTCLSFTVHDGATREDNHYTVTAVATAAGREICHTQEIVCASAPYFKPTIDGRRDDWKDAIPATFVTDGKKTTISTLWNRRQFSLLIAVEEDELIPQREAHPFDAVQIAISPQDTKTSTDAKGEATRFEFLLVSGGAGQGGKCYLLCQPSNTLADLQTERDLNSLEQENPKLAVWREGNTTYYEWGVSFRSLAGIRPSEGREFFLSILVHDPDGAGLRDWGQAAGLWPCQRNRLAWSNWPGAHWPETPPTDNKVEWGMCSSKY